MSFIFWILIFTLYWVLCLYLVEKYRKNELKESSPWYGKDGVERECLVCYYIISTPVYLLVSWVFKRFSGKKSTAK